MPSVQEGRVRKTKAKRPRSPIRRVSKVASFKSNSMTFTTRADDQSVPLVEKTNALSIGEFIAQYVTPSTRAEESVRSDGIDPSNLSQHEPKQSATTVPPVDIYSAATISATDLEKCLDLIEQTSGEAYAASSTGWSRTKKRKEMKLPDMKYLILRNGPDQSSVPNEGRMVAERQGDNVDINASALVEKKGDGPSSLSAASSSNVLGFLSFMVTYEDGKEVVYCYEIHLSEIARGRGVGKLLMDRMEDIGRAVGLEKAMLTVFKSNEHARRFYGRLGYGVDAYSPRPRKLRNGTIKEAEYEILSKRLNE